ncbi:acid phosphatase-domain-containing protein [Favolaschia claudopus]|uniref:Acid phosphatase-domain-containing protein n=1 Tax=Favolaschia claudopus TaxID=2862362 RepID=A0AAW0DDL4_9AGAR
MNFPRLIAFDLDYTFWRGVLKNQSPGRPSRLVPDDLALVGASTIVDKRYNRDVVILYPDVPHIITEIAAKGARIAIVAGNTDKELCDRALWYCKTLDPKTWKLKPIIFFVQYDEVYNASKIKHFQRIGDWSGLEYADMIFFSANAVDRETETKLGVSFKHLHDGLTWNDYRDGLASWKSKRWSRLTASISLPLAFTPSAGFFDRRNYSGLPSLGRKLGSGKFGTVYEHASTPDAVVKIFNNWAPQFQQLFSQVYELIVAGRGVDQLTPSREPEVLRDIKMWAFEFRNLKAVSQLRTPQDPANFTGWLVMSRAQGVPLWTTQAYQGFLCQRTIADITRPHILNYCTELAISKMSKPSMWCPRPLRHHVASNRPIQLKDAFHLVVDAIEEIVQAYGIEHCDPHLANVMFEMRGDRPIKAHLFDWGIAVRMTWDGVHYVRGNDGAPWVDQEKNAVYTRQQFRIHWISWMVRTEYEAYVRRGVIKVEDLAGLREDLPWWQRR